MASVSSISFLKFIDGNFDAINNYYYFKRKQTNGKKTEWGIDVVIRQIFFDFFLKTTPTQKSQNHQKTNKQKTCFNLQDVVGESGTIYPSV